MKMTLLFLSLVALCACDFNYQPTCKNDCAAGGGDDQFGGAT